MSVRGGRGGSGGAEAQPEWCDRCGGALAEGDHDACRTARVLEPPRFCPWCRRRMKVQVLPGGWRAECVEHGALQG
ncbi:MAG TPA: hypothetical protein VK453_09325 [Micromonosporaceae bacterium]|nr:hypothetical protein [Micromonosporaceae bacterium]